MVAKKQPRAPAAPRTVSEHLEVAARSLESKRFEEALVPLLEAWRPTRNERIAALLEAVDKQITRRPLGGASLSAKHERWLEVAAERDPADISRLLAALTSGWAKSAAARIDVLAEWEDDPRIAAGLIAFCRLPGYKSSGPVRAMLDVARATLVRIADPRSLGALGVEQASLSSEIAVAVESRFGASIRALDAEASLHVAAMEALLDSERSEEELYEAVYSDPDDDAARAILSDYLLQEGDPRGELIMLQLARASGQKPKKSAAARESELLKKHGRAWLGPLAKVVPASGAVFERGFLERCVVQPPNTRTMVALADEPAWSTVRAIEFIAFGVPFGFLASPPLRNVRRLSGIDAGCAVELAAHSPLALQSLQVSLGIEDVRPLAEAFADAPGLTRLEELAFNGDSLFAAQLERIWAGALVQRLRRLTVSSDTSQIGAWLTAAHGTPLINLSIAGMYDVVCSRRAAKEPWTVFVRTNAWIVEHAIRLREGIVSAPEGMVGALRIGKPRSEYKKDLERGLGDLAKRVEWVHDPI